MTRPFASIIRLLAAPRLSVVGPGVLRAHIPFLKLIGIHSGTIEMASAVHETGPARWVEVVALLLPSVTRLSYDTAAASVDLHHPAKCSSSGRSGDDEQLQRCVRKLVDAATESAAKFMVMNRERRAQARNELIRALKSTPIDLRADDAAARLQRLIDQL